MTAKIYRDNIATVHVRNCGAKHTAEPAVNRVANSNIKSSDRSQRCCSKDAMRFTIVRQERALRQRSCLIRRLESRIVTSEVKGKCHGQTGLGLFAARKSLRAMRQADCYPGVD